MKDWVAMCPRCEKTWVVEGRYTEWYCGHVPPLQFPLATGYLSPEPPIERIRCLKLRELEDE